MQRRCTTPGRPERRRPAPGRGRARRAGAVWPTSLEDVVAAARTDALLLVLDGVTDPHNLGACLRVADAHRRSHAVVAPKDRAVGITPTVSKVASGAAETRALHHGHQPGAHDRGAEGARAAGDRRGRGGAEDLFAADLTRAARLGAGRRGRGNAAAHARALRPAGAHSDAGKVESLNVSVAAALCLYETTARTARLSRGACH